jgi:hypothetical protein
MTLERPFAEEFLKQPSSKKLDYFKKQVIVPHRNLKNLLDELLANVLNPTDALVYLVFGVTGVGKTTLRKELEKRILKELLEDLRANPGQIAIAGIETPGSEGGKFSHKDYYIRALEALKEVLIDYKIDYDICEDDEHNSGKLLGTSGKDSRALRRAMEKVFIHRQLLAFTVDEAQHLFEVAGGRQMRTQMNWIKSIANLTSTVHLLFGTYELLNCPSTNGQVGRRSEDYHLARYHLDNKNDFTQYQKVIKTLQRHLPLPEEPQLEKHCEYLMKYSLGCVGSLKTWWLRSLRIALADNAKTLTLKHLKKTELSPARRKQIQQEAEAGETRLKEFLKDDQDLLASTSLEQQKTQSGSNKRPVGERNPKRDPVGVN